MIWTITLLFTIHAQLTSEITCLAATSFPSPCFLLRSAANLHHCCSFHLTPELSVLSESFSPSSWNINIKPSWSVYELPAKLSLPVCLLPRIHRTILTSHGPGKSNLFFNLFMKLAVPLQYLLFSFKGINFNWNMGLNNLHCSQMPISC